MALLGAKILHNELHDGVTRYAINVTINGTPRTRVSRRFREFGELLAQLERFSPELQLPPLPPKRYFGNLDPSFVARRQCQLQDLMEALIRCVSPARRPAWRLLCFFLGVSPDDRALTEALESSSTSRLPLRTEASAGFGSIGGDTETAEAVAAAASDQEVVPSAADSRELERLEGIVDAMSNTIINVSHSVFESMNASDGERVRVDISSGNFGSSLTNLLTLPAAENAAHTTSMGPLASADDEAMVQRCAERLLAEVAQGLVSPGAAEGLVVSFSIAEAA